MTIREIRELCTTAHAQGFSLYTTEQGLRIEHCSKAASLTQLYPNVEHIKAFLDGVAAGRATAHLYAKETSDES